MYDPFHGHIECSGPQVTNEICTFSCNPGYNLTGVEERVCLPNGSWSGTDVMCPALQCPELETTFNVLIVPSCFAEYNYSCTLVCADGYYLEDKNFFEQTCALQQDGNVSWTDPKSCFGKKF